MKIMREISMGEILTILNNIINRMPGWKMEEKQC